MDINFTRFYTYAYFTFSLLCTCHGTEQKDNENTTHPLSVDATAQNLVNLVQNNIQTDLSTVTQTTNTAVTNAAGAANTLLSNVHAVVTQGQNAMPMKLSSLAQPDSHIINVFSPTATPSLETAAAGLSTLSTLAQNHSTKAKKNDFSHNDPTRNGREPSIASELLGNQSAIFSNPCLERYAKCSVLMWHIINAFLDDIEAFSQGAATAFIAYAGTVQGPRQAIITTLALQVGFIAHALHKLSVFSEQVVKAREKQALTYIHINRLKKQERQNPVISLEMSREDLELNAENYSSPSIEGFYSCCATARNIAWDNLGVYVILLQSAAYSLMNWSTAFHDEKTRQKFIVIATFCSIAGTACQYYIKALSRNTPKAEHKATHAHKINQHRAAYHMDINENEGEEEEDNV